MIVIALLFALLIIILQWPTWWRERRFKELIINGSLLTMALVMAMFVQLHYWWQFDPLKPIELVFQPMTKWFYNIL